MNLKCVTLGLSSKYIPYVNESKLISQLNNTNWPFIALILYLFHHNIWSEQVKCNIGYVMKALGALGPWCLHTSTTPGWSVEVRCGDPTCLGPP